MTWDENLFETLEIPTDLDKAILVNTILLKYGDLSPIVSSPTKFKDRVGLWSRSNKYTFDKLAETLKFEYNPIHNVDADEWEYYRDNRQTQQKKDGTNSSDTTGNSNTDANGTDTSDTSAYNSSSYQPEDKRTFENTNNTDYRSNVNGDYTDNFDGNEDFTHDRHTKRQGNIGVTSTQELIRQEREIAMFNIYDTIARMFKRDLLLTVWNL